MEDIGDIIAPCLMWVNNNNIETDAFSGLLYGVLFFRVSP
jgi:hypothetical protein